MTDKEIGHIRHIARLSLNPWGDWTGFDTVYNPLQGEKMFVISFMAYTLELAQHELTPAYHEIYRTSIENLLKKMQHPDVWYPWMFESRHGSVEEIKGEPVDWMTNPGWIDPILKDNIQFKAYIQQIAAAYQMLYGDKRYEQPGAFTFKWTGGMSNGQMNFRYTLTDITRTSMRKWWIPTLSVLRVNPAVCSGSAMHPPTPVSSSTTISMARITAMRGPR